MTNEKLAPRWKVITVLLELIPIAIPASTAPLTGFLDSPTYQPKRREWMGKRHDNTHQVKAPLRSPGLRHSKYHNDPRHTPTHPSAPPHPHPHPHIPTGRMRHSSFAFGSRRNNYSRAVCLSWPRRYSNLGAPAPLQVK